MVVDRGGVRRASPSGCNPNLERMYKARIRELAGRITKLIAERDGLQQQLASNPEVLCGRMARDAELIDELRGRLDQATVDNESLSCALLRKPDFYCASALETLHSVGVLLEGTVDRIGATDGKKLTMGDYARLREETMAARAELTEIKTAHRLRKHAHRCKGSESEWVAALRQRHDTQVSRAGELDRREKKNIAEDRRIVQDRAAVEARRRENIEATRQLKDRGEIQAAREERFEAHAKRRVAELAERERELDERCGMRQEEEDSKRAAFAEILRAAVNRELASLQHELAESKKMLSVTAKALSAESVEVQRKELHLKGKEREIEELKTRVQHLEGHIDTIKGHLDEHKGTIKGHEEDAARRAQKKVAKASRIAAAEKLAADEFLVTVKRREADQERILAVDMAEKFKHMPEEDRAMQFQLHDLFFVPAPGDNSFVWPGLSGLIMDEKGLHFFNAAKKEAASVPYGNVHSWYGGPRSPLGNDSWAFTDKKANEDGRITIFVRKHIDAPPLMVVQLESEAAKAIHNMLAVLFEKFDRRVRTRAAWEVKEDEKELRKKRSMGAPAGRVI